MGCNDVDFEIWESGSTGTQETEEEFAQGEFTVGTYLYNTVGIHAYFVLYESGMSSWFDKFLGKCLSRRLTGDWKVSSMYEYLEKKSFHKCYT